ncbi:MAG: competence type IV pilus major pilin ComGC [Sporolactobacillus sp.]|uniref:competence type IV pilus major pilin ComGC n=1 Tax=Sporolactobacillus sp. STSJ-5 TaxID=2965076 RepID=UPI002105492F|nr:competence type IV pilus major pilin ComGC [Sporolactobacillus sp. STSJ-5]MCQ2008402.1 prepilin-type N-terminal cleavage/methylation domain-containing protein [Sporolactobacillus sp. STSJ-5]
MLKIFRKFIFMSQRGFTLIEMMIVLFIISILLLIAVPNMTKSNDVVMNKSTDATVKLVQSQIAAYQMDHDGALPESLDDLMPDYVNSIKSSDGTPLNYDASTGEVSVP